MQVEPSETEEERPSMDLYKAIFESSESSSSSTEDEDSSENKHESDKFSRNRTPGSAAQTNDSKEKDDKMTLSGEKDLKRNVEVGRFLS